MMMQSTARARAMAVMQRLTSDEEECNQDEDALLKSKWSLALFSELHSEQQDIIKLGKWLQVCLSIHCSLSADIFQLENVPNQHHVQPEN
jgi:hypothetical protein